jgi:hypothetical protein
MTSPSPQSGVDAQAIIQQMVAKVVNITDPAKLSATVAELMTGLPDPLQRQIACSVGLSNPLYTPDDAYAARMWRGQQIGLTEFADIVLRLKKAVQTVRAPRILLACPRKTASTFLSAVLVNALGAQESLLTLPVARLQNAGALGAAMREHEMDELALLRACFLPTGFVSQQHVRCTPYLASQLALYHVQPILLKRNLLDSLVSLDDMCLEAARAHHADKFYFFTHLPHAYKDMSDDWRMATLIRLYLPWYLSFYASWRKCEARGLVAPLWISYEQDVKGEPAELAEKLAAYIGGQATTERIAAAIVANTGKQALKFNKGVVGRGQRMSDANRDMVRDYVDMFRDEVDFSDLID